MREGRFPHPADGVDAAREGYPTVGGKLFGRLRSELCYDLRDRCGKVELVAVSLKAKGFDIAYALKSLFKQTVFERQ
jgi:hypothetical protein